MNWTDEAQAVLVKFAAEGKSYQDVADELGATRSCVAGRAYRTGVTFHGRKRPTKPRRHKMGLGPARGERHGSAKLTEADVRWLRDGRPGEHSARARELGIITVAAWRIRTGRQWAHLR